MKNFEIKDSVNIKDIQEMHPDLLLLLSYYISYCLKYDLPCLVTSIKDDAPGRISTTHLDGRAFDASVRGWTEQHIFRFVHKCTEDHERIGAISKKDLKPRPVIHHAVKGGAPHFHFQVRR